MARYIDGYLTGSINGSMDDGLMDGQLDGKLGVRIYLATRVKRLMNAWMARYRNECVAT